MATAPHPGRNVFLIEQATRTPVAAVIRTHLTSPELTVAERSWRPVREELSARQRRAGRRRVTEHGHWDWAREGKTDAVDTGRTIAVGVECAGEWQGLMAVFADPQPS